MEALYVTVALAGAFLASLYAWKFFNWAWLQPTRKEKRLRQLGFKGNKYRFLVGDYREINAKTKELHSKPISFSNDILTRAMVFFHQAFQDYGEKCFIWFGTKPTVLITDPEMIKEILSKNNVFQKVKNPMRDLQAQGIAVLEKDKWTKRRRLINPAFHLEKLKLMLPSFYLSCGDLLSKWDMIAPSDGGSFEVDVWPYLDMLTYDAISRTAFGSSYEEGRKVFQLQKELGMLISGSKSLLIPGWRFLPTKVNRRMKEIARQTESSIMEIIHKRMHLIKAGEVNFNDLLGILLESNFREIQENGNESGMSLGDIVSECKLFYLAGQTTTTALLTWAMILLGKHLDWQARAREEVLQVLSSDKSPDLQDLNHLKIINMIVHEVLRLYPPGVMLSREINEETAVGNITLPAGVWIFMPVVYLHHDRNMWGEDAKEFKPERFSEGVSKATKGQFSYIPFGWGPRICIGQNFTMLQAKMALAMILQHYSFEVSPSYAHAPAFMHALKPQLGAQLILRRI